MAVISCIQGTSVTAFSVQDEIEPRIKKLNLWCNRIEKGKYDFFRTLSDFIDFSKQPLSSDVAESIIEYMRSLASQLRLDEDSFSRFGIWTSFCRRRTTYRAVLLFTLKFPKGLLRHVLPFATTYLCETTFFSSCTYEKQRSRLNVEPDLRLKLSSFDPDMRKLTSEKQHQPSH
jgi:hypothetical protein